ncbi:type I restriction endonuclease [Luteimonas kalidii]|uniref:Type I restriction endonuclease n=1 Tax=Luteimonas kalidii TaxID=3042025 RepID=A0ABT6JVM2_9GAMM|nr:type I restriction endonuclease [Luteimonas kalidii]MDH5834226.1 type I restriction endonuclease [Luteimonas kalidii]
MWTTEGLISESDVEQKFVYPLLIASKPLGAGLPTEVIQTKFNIRRLPIGKGKEQKLYFPDYLLVASGYPLVVIEAKGPTESAQEGYRQARLYAAELNALYPHDINPSKYVVATNGQKLIFGHADSDTPICTAECAGLGVYSSEIAQLVALIEWSALKEMALRVAALQRPQNLFKPRRLIGGVGVQNEEVGRNAFGATLTAEISKIFNPVSQADRAEVVRNAYVPSRRRERYIDPIDRVIRAARPPSEIDAQRFEDTSKPTELVRKLRQKTELEHQVMLLVGSVGSGKSTFVDYLQEVALPAEIVKSTVWSRLNMNAAPVSAQEIYPWLREQLIQACRNSLPSLDFDELDVLEKLYGVEISKFKKGVGRLYESQPEVWAVKLGEQIQLLQADANITTNAHVRFACGERAKLCIVVLDNCDKKNRDEQLLMFEAAQWLQKEFRCLVILPLRDETYDNHKDQPPLDTALKDLVFRIEPPLFQHVLMKRVQLALKQLSTGSGSKLQFYLPNGFQVEYPPSEQAFYLTSVIKSLFEHDRFARRMIVGLSGRNMRRALEIFLEFCNSGYIGEDQIFKIRQSEGNYVIPLHQVATVLLRMNRRFYDSDFSYIKNIFAANIHDPLPAYFCRYMILGWLRDNFRLVGARGLKGYFRKADVKHALSPYGFAPEVLDREFNYLLAAQCVIAEHLRLDGVDDDDLVRIGPAGFVHLDLIGNVNYLAAVAEDTYFDDRLQAERVSSRIRNSDEHLHLKTASDNAEEVVAFLEECWSRLVPSGGIFMADDLRKRMTAFSDAREALNRIAKSQAGDPWFDADKRLQRGSRHPVVVVNVKEFGFFVEFPDGTSGLVHRSAAGGFVPEPGDRVEVQINWVDVIQRKIGLRMTAFLQEEVGDVFAGSSQSG